MPDDQLQNFPSSWGGGRFMVISCINCCVSIVVTVHARDNGAPSRYARPPGIVLRRAVFGACRASAVTGCTHGAALLRNDVLSILRCSCLRRLRPSVPTLLGHTRLAASCPLYTCILAVDQYAAGQNVTVLHRCQWLQALDSLRIARVPKGPARVNTAVDPQCRRSLPFTNMSLPAEHLHPMKTPLDSASRINIDKKLARLARHLILCARNPAVATRERAQRTRTGHART